MFLKKNKNKKEKIKRFYFNSKCQYSKWKNKLEFKMRMKIQINKIKNL